MTRLIGDPQQNRIESRFPTAATIAIAIIVVVLVAIAASRTNVVIAAPQTWRGWGVQGGGATTGIPRAGRSSTGQSSQIAIGHRRLELLLQIIQILLDAQAYILVQGRTPGKGIPIHGAQR